MLRLLFIRVKWIHIFRDMNTVFTEYMTTLADLLFGRGERKLSLGDSLLFLSLILFAFALMILL